MGPIFGKTGVLGRGRGDSQVFREDGSPFSKVEEFRVFPKDGTPNPWSRGLPVVSGRWEFRSEVDRFRMFRVDGSPGPR